MLAKPNYNLSEDWIATLQSLEALRGASGLLADTALVTQAGLKILNESTSPTNIALDLLILTARVQQQEVAAKAQLAQVLSRLQTLPRHEDSGLFYSRYSSQTAEAVDLAVSSVDNFHLALALWTAKETLAGPPADAASDLFAPMNFSVFLDPETFLVGGNLRHESGNWVREAYNFSHLGSEARALYSAGWALGLFKDHTEPFFFEMVLDALTLEIYNSPEGPLLSLWDGAAFQLFFPELFLKESLYSSWLDQVTRNMGPYWRAEGQRRGLISPAAHTAVRATVGENEGRSAYQDKSGNRDLVSRDNKDLQDSRYQAHWDTLLAPHALFMAATKNRTLLKELSILRQLYFQDGPLYHFKWGWMDALHVAGNLKGQVVPVQLALNQGMLALALVSLQSADGLTPSARALQRNSEVRRKLQQFYHLLDLKVAAQRADLQNEPRPEAPFVLTPQGQKGKVGP